MDNYLYSVKFSQLPKEQVQLLLLRFMQNTQPDKLKFNPKIIEYSDTSILFGMNKHYGRFSLTVDILLQNLSPKLGTQGIKMMKKSKKNDILKLKVGSIEYFDNDIMNIEHYATILRVDSINKLIPGGFKEFAKNKNVWGETNGRLLIMEEMQRFPYFINELYKEILEPNGFEEKKDFVHGFSRPFQKEDSRKPIEWCIVSWLQSVITPFGLFVKFVNPHHENTKARQEYHISR